MTKLEIFISLILLLGIFFLSALQYIYRRMKRRQLGKQLHHLGYLFPFSSFLRRFFFDREYDALLLANTYTLNTLRFSFGVIVAYIIIQEQIEKSILNLALFVLFTCLILLLCSEFFPRRWVERNRDRALRISATIASPFLFLFLPISFPFLYFSSRQVLRQVSVKTSGEPLEEVRERLLDLVTESGLNATLGPQDKKMIESVVTFQDRIAREIMVPRLDVFSLSADTPIYKAVRQLQTIGFSRVPIYRQSVDNIVGVLMYKDLLTKYIEYESQQNNHAILERPIETILKPVIYTPETKKISQLLQEFRMRQVHLAIVVDEYGGTAGIITIEDILEEIVGDIADEFDKEQELFQPQPAGGWIVDARMSMIDIEEQLGLKIPDEGDFDTIGGYIIHRLGMIPPKGFVIQLDDFEIEILSTNDRSIEKVRITTFKPNKEDQISDNW